MRFQSKNSKTPYLNRAAQYQLLALCTMLLIVVLAVRKAADPETWRWITQTPGDSPQDDPRDLRDISFLVKDESQHLEPHEFIGEVLTELPATNASAAPKAGALEFEPELFKAVNDQTIHWTSRDELLALHTVLDRVRAASPEELRTGAREDVGFRYVNQEPETFRGKSIYLQGTLWQLEPFLEGGEQNQVQPIYTGWVFTDDSGNKPWMILCTELPAGLTLGTKLDRPVRVSGVFFKRYGYDTASGQLNVAPLLVAKSFELPPLPQVAQERTNEATLYVAAVLLVSVALLGLMVLWFVLGDRRIAGSRLAELSKPMTPQTLDSELLQQIQTLDPGEALRGLTTTDESQETAPSN